MIGFFLSLEIETRMGENEVSYAGFQFANSRDFVFCFGGRRRGGSLFWRKEKGNGGGRAIHGSSQPEFGPNPHSTRLGRFTEKLTRNQPKYGLDPPGRIIGLAGWTSYWAFP